MPPTVARPHTEESSHWYYPDGRPCYEVPRASGEGTRKTTLADARKLGLLPSVTNILKILHKPALQDWLIEQAVMAVETTPRNADEGLDAFIHRCLHVERIQDQESKTARDRGAEIHDALDALAKSTINPQLPPDLDPQLEAWVMPAWNAALAFGVPKRSEFVLVGNGYAGKCDLLVRNSETDFLIDWKTTKKIPEKGSWPEHKLQLSAYANAHAADPDDALDDIQTLNIYVSTVEPGKFVVSSNGDWAYDYANGFKPLVSHWQWANRYSPGSNGND